MKKLLTIAAACLLSFTMTACSSNNEGGQSTAPQNKLEEIQQKGKLVMAVSPDFPPFEFIDNTKSGIDQYVGADIELGKYIAEQLGVDFEIKAMDFTAVLSSVDLGNADIAISGFGWREDREESFELSHGFNKDGEASCHGFLIKEADAAKYTTLADLANATIAAQVSSLQEGYTKEQLPDAKLQQVTSLDIGVMSLETGKVDALACTCDLAKGYASANEDLVKADAEFDITYDSEHDGNVAAVQKGQTELLAKINEIIDEVNEKGLYDEWNTAAKATAKELGIKFED